MQKHYHHTEQKVVRGKTSFGSSEEAVAALTPGRRRDTVSGNRELLPGFVLALPDPGCASYLTFFVSQGHYLKSGANDRTQLTGVLWGLNDLINAKVFEGCLACCQCQSSVCYFQEHVQWTP